MSVDKSTTGNDDWEETLPRLLLWAGRLHARTLADVRGAPTPEDLVQDAVTDVLTGRRTRPDGVPLAVVLYGVVRSRVSHTLERARSSGEAGGPRFVGLDAAERAHADAAADPAHVADLRKRVLHLVEGDEVLSRMVGLWFEDPSLKASDLAAILDLSPSEIYAAARRLRRRPARRDALGFDAAACSSLGDHSSLIPRWLKPLVRWPFPVTVFPSPANSMRPSAFATVLAVVLGACSAAGPAVSGDEPALVGDRLPEIVAPPYDHPPSDPLVLPFEGRAGQEVWLRARPMSGLPVTLCVATADGWDLYQSGGQPAGAVDEATSCGAGHPDPFTRESSLREVLPEDGQYVLVASGPFGDAPGPFRLEEVGGRQVPLLERSANVLDTLGAARPWNLYLDAGPVTTHFVEGTAGDRLDVTVESEGFVPYVEVGGWYGDGHTPLVGSTDSTATTASLTLPADGVYTVRVSDLDGGTGPYSIRADLAEPAPWSARFSDGGDPADRYALLVAVSDYPSVGPEEYGDLAGPRADADAMRDLLVGTYGFAPENVLVLRDADATRETVTEAFRRHLGQAGAGGTALFHYSGHGMQLPAAALPTNVQGRAEDDGLDEALVLWGHGGEVSYLVDHELGALAEGLAADHTVLILDNCFSGDGSRALAGDDRGVAVRELLYEDVASRVRTPERLLSDDPNVGARRHVLLAASSPDQVSLELGGLAPDGGRAGVFTTALVRDLLEADGADSFERVVARVRGRVQRTTQSVMAEFGYLPQSPQVEGAQAGASLADVLGRPERE